MFLAILILLLILGVSFYYNLRFMRNRENMLDQISINFHVNMLLLYDSHDVLVYLIDSNAFEGLIRYKLAQIVSNAHTMRAVTFILYKQLEEEKYYVMSAAFANLESFYIDLSNDAPGKIKERLRANRDIIVKISNILHEMINYYDLRDIPEDMVSELLVNTEQLNR